MIPDTDAHLVPANAEDVHEITRPNEQLWMLFLIYALLSTVAFPIVILPLYFRYKTLRYRFDDHGVSVSYGLIWRRETYLTYARIQDIHVTRNIFERWLGIGTVKIQTASGSSAATESIVGLTAFQEVRNYLYAHMRGHRNDSGARAVRASDASAPALGGATHATGATGQTADAQTVDALSGIRDELRAVRLLLEAESPRASADGPSDV